MCVTDRYFLFRMEAENFLKPYIVKLPNQSMGTGTCMVNHPDQVWTVTHGRN